MRILLLTEAGATGVGKHVCDLAEGLSERGHAVHLLYSPIRVDAAFAERVATESHSARYTSAAIRIPHHPGIGDLAAISAVRRYIHKSGPFDVVHSHSSKAGLVGRLAAIGSGAAIVYTPHAFATMDPAWPTPYWVAMKAGEQLLARVSNRIIVVSEQERNHALSLGISSRRLVVIPNGIKSNAKSRVDASSRAKLRSEWGLAEADVCIGSVGRLTRQKGIGFLLTAASILIHQRENTVLAVVGDGPLRGELVQRAQALGIGHAVRWCGAIEGEAAMAAFDIFALTSEYEGFPYVLLEAMSAGLPIVTTDVGGVRALIDHGHNGFVVAGGDAERASKHLNQLAESKTLRARVGERAAERVASFSVERMVEATLTEYRCVVGSAARHPSPVDASVPS